VRDISTFDLSLRTICRRFIFIFYTMKKDYKKIAEMQSESIKKLLKENQEQKLKIATLKIDLEMQEKYFKNREFLKKANE